MKRIFSNWSAGASAVALALMVTACGGSSSDEDARGVSDDDRSSDDDDDSAKDDDLAKDDDDEASSAGDEQDDDSEDAEPGEGAEPSSGGSPSGPDGDPSSPAEATGGGSSSSSSGMADVASGPVGSTPAPAATGVAMPAPAGMSGAGYASSGGVAVAGPGRPVPAMAPGGSGTLPDPDDCETEYRSEADEYCELQLTCGDGEDFINSFCSQNRGDSYLCNCYSSQAYRSYELAGVEPGEACQYLLDLCSSEEQPEFEGDPECQVDYQSASEDWCDMQLACSLSSDLGDGVQARQTSYQSINCNGPEGECYCSGGRGSIQLSLGDAVDIDSCNQAMDICTKASEGEFDAPIACAQSYQSASDDYCNGNMDCTQSVEIDGVAVEMYAYVNSYCSLNESGGWSCTCNSGASYAEFEMELSGTPWESCSEATAACPDLIDVKPGDLSTDGSSYGPYVAY